MKRYTEKAKLIFLLAIGLIHFSLTAQNTAITLSPTGILQYAPLPPYSAYTTHFDGNDQPYIYAASGELGLVIIDITDPTNPEIVENFPPQEFGGLNVMNLQQHGSTLYLALGAFALMSQNAGLATIDVSDPLNAEILDVWSDPEFSDGAPVVLSDGNLAFLGAMESGVLILDVSQPDNIQFISNILPDPNFPEPPAFLSQPAARGLAFRNDTLFVCNDAKGFRLIDVSNPQEPLEIGLHMNFELHTAARPAYNEVVLHGKYAYVTVDYCGLDVVDLSGDEMETVYWYNPWNCSPTNWACSPGHTNQLQLVGDSLLFMSGADTELIVMDISNPAEPQPITTFGNPGNLSVTWGMSVRDHQIALAHVHFTFECGGIVPYQSNWGGLQLLEWAEDSVTSVSQPGSEQSIQFFPNPFSRQTTLVVSENLYNQNLHLRIFNANGKAIYNRSFNTNAHVIHASELGNGLFIFQLSDDTKILETGKLIVQP